MLELLRVLWDKEYAQEYLDNNKTVYYMLLNSVADGCVSTIFTSIGIENNIYMT